MGFHDVFLLNYVILVFLKGFLMVPVYMQVQDKNILKL